MTDRRELLAMLTAHGIDPTKVHGGTPNLTQMDVAAMMSRLTLCESALLRAKYANDYSVNLYDMWQSTILAQEWDATDQQIATLCEVTLSEHIGEPRCRSCNGTKGRIINSKWQECPNCKGRGYKAVSDREIARRLDKQRLQEPWVTRLAWCRDYLRITEESAVKKLY